jgi:hypothetical protein
MKGGPWVPAFFLAESISPQLPHTGRGASIALYAPTRLCAIVVIGCASLLAPFSRTLTANLIFAPVY